MHNELVVLVYHALAHCRTDHILCPEVQWELWGNASWKTNTLKAHKNYVFIYICVVLHTQKLDLNMVDAPFKQQRANFMAKKALSE